MITAASVTSAASEVVGSVLPSHILEDIDRETKGDGETVEVFLKIDIQVYLILVAS